MSASKGAKRIAIIGGGITGLATAYELARQGQTEFALLEASGRLGGIVETVRTDGFVIECGPDSWVSEKPWARDLALELGLEDELIPSNDATRRTYLLRGNDLVPMPDGMRMMVPVDLRSIEEAPLFSERAKRAYREEPARAEELRHLAMQRPPDFDESVSSFVRRHFGEEITATLAGPLLAGVFGGDVEQLSAAAVMPAFVKMEREHGSLVTAVQKQQRELKQNAAVFTTLRSGLQTLIECMADRLPADTVRLHHPVISLARVGARWQVTTANASELYDSVVIAAPVHVARQLLASLDARFDDLLGIEATSAIVIALAYEGAGAERPQIPPGFGFLVPQPKPTTARSLLACTFVDQKFAHRVPAGGRLLRAFYGGDAASALLNDADEPIAAAAHKQLSRVFPGLPTPRFSLVRRWPRSLPQYTVGHLQRVARIEALTSTLPGLFLIGNGYRGVGLPDLIHREGPSRGPCSATESSPRRHSAARANPTGRRTPRRSYTPAGSGGATWRSGFPGHLLHVAHDKEPRDSTEHQHGGGDCKRTLKASGLLQNESGERGRDDTGEICEPVLQPCPSAHAVRSGKRLRKSEEPRPDDPASYSCNDQPAEVVSSRLGAGRDRDRGDGRSDYHHRLARDGRARAAAYPEVRQPPGQNRRRGVHHVVRGSGGCHRLHGEVSRMDEIKRQPGDHEINQVVPGKMARAGAPEGTMPQNSGKTRGGRGDRQM